MPASRFHPLARLCFCALGLLVIAIVMALTFLLGGAIATLWTGQNQSAYLAAIAQRYSLPLTVFSYPAAILWISYCRTHFDLRSFTSLGLRGQRAITDMLRGAVTGVLAIGFLWCALWLTGAISVVGWAPEAVEKGVGQAILLLMGYAVAFAAVGFAEEVSFRGYALHNLSNWLGWKGGLFVQAVLFALIHLGNITSSKDIAPAMGALPSLFLIAIFFALCYRKTGSLWFPIGFHNAWNFFLGCVFSLPVSGIRTFHLLEVQTNPGSQLSGGSFGAEGSLLLIPILLAMIYFISQAPDHPQASLDLGLLELIFPSPTQIPTEAETEGEEPRGNRFRTKFGTSQGFSAETLRELRELQENRERAQAEATERARREALATSSFAPLVVAPMVIPEATSPQAEAIAPPSPTPVTLPTAPTVTAPVPAPIPGSTQPTPISIPTPAPASSPAPVPHSAPTSTPAPTPAPPSPEATPLKKKPPSPRW